MTYLTRLLMVGMLLRRRLWWRSRVPDLSLCWRRFVLRLQESDEARVDILLLMQRYLTVLIRLEEVWMITQCLRGRRMSVSGAETVGWAFSFPSIQNLPISTYLGDWQGALFDQVLRRALVLINVALGSFL